MRINKKTRIEVYNKCNGHCAYCGEEIELGKMQVDHIIPQRNFINSIQNMKLGNIEMRFIKVPDFLRHLNEEDCNHIDNLLPTCGSCNNRKNTLTIEQFRSEISEQLSRLKKNNANYRLAKRFNLVEERTMPIVFYFEKVSCEQN